MIEYLLRNYLFYDVLYQALFSEGISGFPWYLYAGAGGLIYLFGKTVAGIATDAIREIELEDAAEAAALDLADQEAKKKNKR